MIGDRVECRPVEVEFTTASTSYCPDAGINGDAVLVLLHLDRGASQPLAFGDLLPSMGNGSVCPSADRGAGKRDLPGRSISGTKANWPPSAWWERTPHGAATSCKGCGTWLAFPVAIIFRRDPVLLTKFTGEVKRILKAALFRDFLDREPGIDQQIRRLFQSVPVEQRQW